MNAIERMRATEQGLPADRAPFVPSVYEHGAFLIGKTPSELSVDAKLIVEAQSKAYELYGHDLISVGVDIYNIEAQALGCEVEYFTDGNVPCVSTRILDEVPLEELKVPDPCKDGRMPMMLDAVEQLAKRYGKEVPVNGTLVGPMTLAAIITGYEKMVLLMITEPEECERILDFTTQVCTAFASAYMRLGVGININESWISQPVLSPSLYHDFVFERHKKIIAELRSVGDGSIGIISGGDTTAICRDLSQTGSSILMADYCCDQTLYKKHALAAGIMLRGSINSKLVRTGPVELIKKETHELLRKCADGGRFILGCGVVPYDAPPEHVLAVKEAEEEFYGLR